MALKVKLKKPKKPDRLPFAELEKGVSAWAKELEGRWSRFIKAVVKRLEARQKEVKRSLDEEDPGVLLGILDDLQPELLDTPAQKSIDTFTLAPFQTGVVVAKRGENDGDFFAPIKKSEVRHDTPEDKAAWSHAKARTYSDVRSKDDAQMATFRAVLLEDLREGKAPAETAKRVGEVLEEKADGWTTIARTESARALNAGMFSMASALGKQYVYVPSQPSACRHCEQLLIGRVFPADALQKASNVGVKQPNWKAAIPLHPNCRCVPLPASSWTQQQAENASEGTIPNEGIKIEYLPPGKR